MKDDRKALFGAYRDKYKYLYMTALAICGNELTAEDVLFDVIVVCGVRGARKRALKEIKRMALERTQGESEIEFLECAPFENDTALVKRIILLGKGCGLSVRQIAKACAVRTEYVRSALARGGNMRSIDKICRAELTAGAYAPDVSTFRQALTERIKEESLASAAGHKGTVKGLVSILLALILGFLIWLGAVLVDYTAQWSAERPGTEVVDAAD